MRSKRSPKSRLFSVLGIALGLTVLALVFGKPIEHLAERFFKRKRSVPTDPSV